MMPRFLTLLALVAMLATPTLATQDAAAQPSPEEFLSRLDGLETAYGRRYDGAHVHDFNLGPTPVVTHATPDRLIAIVLEFGTEEELTDAFDNVLNGLIVGTILGEMGMDLERTTVDDLGDRAELFSGETHGHAALLAVQDGNIGFLIHAYGEDDAIHETMKEIAGFMVDAELSGTPVSIDDLGATGGTFDLMPGPDDADVLNGLVPMYEYDLLISSSPIETVDRDPDATPEN